MPRGKAWSKPESVALVEAFVHISEDEIIGVNQRKDTLFERVVNEAKQRYSGDWGRGLVACRSRWQIVSREVSKFIAADLLVNAIERSGWNDENYYKATILAYHDVRGNKGTPSDIHEDDLPLSDSEWEAVVPEFEFKEEWLILRDHEKWRSTLSKQETKRKAENRDPNLGPNDSNDATPSPHSRPIGIKKAKTALAMKNNQEALLDEIRNQHVQAEQARQTNQVDRTKIISDLRSHMDAAAATSFQNFRTVVNESTQEITKAIKIKLLMESNWTTMDKSFRARCKKTVRKYLEDTLESESEGQDSSDDDDGGGKVKES